MNLSLNWLNQFVNLDGLEKEEIIDRIIKAGFEVESVNELGSGTNLVVGKVIECHDHPDSDHLHVTKVDIGNEILDIVCGAPNCREGLKVIVAKVGAKLVGGEIKKSTIRGVESNGMLCSLLELNVPKEILDDDSPSLNGIEELDDNFEVGEEGILKKLGYEDTILELSIYANRPDCLAMFSLAKEMAAILNRPCILPELKNYNNEGIDTSFILHSETDNCPHFLAKVVNHVTLKKSPKWMRDILRSNGIKSINNIVDISNLVMLETGQPMHFYDLRSNPHREITVKDDLEVDYIALDGNTYHIEKGDLMITSNGEPIGIAGIMGGDNTKILDDTSAIIIECALFEQAQIRRTANRLGLQTEAAMRYAKGLDPLAQQKAIDRAMSLLIEYAEASEYEKTVEFGSDNYNEIVVKETLEHLNALIGKKYEMDEVRDILNRLDFHPEIKDDSFISHIPSYRTDIRIREDIDEEIIRLSGYDDLATTLPLMPQTIGKLTVRQSMRRTIEDLLTNAGLYETITYTLVGSQAVRDNLMPLGDAIELKQPLSDARKYIRTSLMPSMLECLAYNIAHNNENVNLFEISSIYAKDMQEERLAIILSGKLQESKVLHNTVDTNFYVLKGLIMSLLDKLGFPTGRIQIVENNVDASNMHPYQSALIKLNNKVIGIFGKVHPQIAKERKLPDAYYLEMSLEQLIESKPAKIKASEINRYPSISRDISLVVKDDVKSSDLIRIIERAGGSLVSSVEVFDIYKGEHIKDGYMSISLNIIYESKDKTLKIEDINPVHEKILSELSKQYQANLRQ